MDIRESPSAVIDRILSIYFYDKDLAAFFHLKNHKNSKAGDRAGSKTKAGYEYIRVKGWNIRTHRAVWLMEKGEFPTKELDHIDGDILNNRIENLRECNRLENMQNVKKYKPRSTSIRPSQYLGVSWKMSRQKWVALIRVNGVQKHLGYFDEELDAAKAYEEAKYELHTFNPVVRR